MQTPTKFGQRGRIVNGIRIGGLTLDAPPHDAEPERLWAFCAIAAFHASDGSRFLPDFGRAAALAYLERWPNVPEDEA